MDDLDMDELEFDENDFEEFGSSPMGNTSPSFHEDDLGSRIMDAEDIIRRNPSKALEILDETLRKIDTDSTIGSAIGPEDLKVKCISHIVKLCSASIDINLEALEYAVEKIQQMLTSETVSDHVLGDMIWSSLSNLRQSKRTEYLYRQLSHDTETYLQRYPGPGSIWNAYTTQTILCCFDLILQIDRYTSDEIKYHLIRLKEVIKRTMEIPERTARLEVKAADACAVYGILSLHVDGNDYGHMNRWETCLFATLASVDPHASLFSLTQESLLLAQGWTSNVLLGIYWFTKCLTCMVSSQTTSAYAYAMRSLSLLLSSGLHETEFVNSFICFILPIITILRIQLPLSTTSCPFSSVDGKQILNSKYMAVHDLCSQLSKLTTDQNMGEILRIVPEFKTLPAIEDPCLVWLVRYIQEWKITSIIDVLDGSKFRFTYDKDMIIDRMIHHWFRTELTHKITQLEDGPIRLTLNSLSSQLNDDLAIAESTHESDITRQLIRSMMNMMNSHVFDGYLTPQFVIIVSINTELCPLEIKDLRISRFNGRVQPSLHDETARWTESLRIRIEGLKLCTRNAHSSQRRIDH